MTDRERRRTAPLVIRRAMVEDAEAIGALAASLSHFFTVHPDGAGAERFLETLAPPALRAYICAPAFAYWVGCVENRLVGVVALRDGKHLFHLFVAPSLHGRGFGRCLWNHAKAAAVAAGNRSGFTVNATPCAQPIYERFGFTAVGPRVETNGVAYIPMKLDRLAG